MQMSSAALNNWPDWTNFGLGPYVMVHGSSFWGCCSADFFAFTGGSATLLAHGMSTGLEGSRSATLWTWELRMERAQAAAWNLQMVTADVVLVTPSSWHGRKAQSMLAAAVQAPRPPGVRAIVVAGAPPFPHSHVVTQGEELMRAQCMVDPGIELAFVDPLGPFLPEFVVLVQSCKSLRWVIVNNVNLAEMAGWISRFLVNVSGWHLLTAGDFQWPEVVLSRPVPQRRQWHMLARGDALRQQPPALGALFRRAMTSSNHSHTGSTGIDLDGLLFSGFVNPCRYVEVHSGHMGLNHFVDYPGVGLTYTLGRSRA